MSAPAWMPFYVADYLADTGHLSTLEHGAYLLLIMHYWQNGGLPTEDAKLSRIARLPTKQWLQIRETIAALFGPDWRHKRIDQEMQTATEEMSKRSAAGRAAGLASAAARQRLVQRSLNGSHDDRLTNDATVNQRSSTPSPSPKKEKQDAADAATKTPEGQLYERGEKILGPGTGGLITNLLKAKDGNVALARAAIETASTKGNPREYIGAIARKPKSEAEMTADERREAQRKKDWEGII
jgi:uncharacterized protein YdaU (DUF1376 family)